MSGLEDGGGAVNNTNTTQLTHTSGRNQESSKYIFMSKEREGDLLWHQVVKVVHELA